jgi:hypothetical protein
MESRLNAERRVAVQALVSGLQSELAEKRNDYAMVGQAIRESGDPQELSELAGHAGSLKKEIDVLELGIRNLQDQL